MKLINKFLKYLFPALVLLLMLFIPLYPKLPLIDVKNTWVYVRVEDFLVLFVLVAWFVMLVKKKVTLKTPLTIPIMCFWIVGALVTIHGVVIIFPQIKDVFPNVALLEYLRHIEYLSLFFVAVAAVKSKNFVFASIWTVIVTLLGVIIYGFGQKYFSFPAYLTMNEEYAKGIPILISQQNRVSSTFAGHYDLAAYLVLIIPIVVSLFFGFKNIFVKIFLFIVSLFGLALMFLTVSRVSFFALSVALLVAFLFYKKKLIFLFVPLILIVGAVFLYSKSSLLARFDNTVKEVDVLVDAATGTPVGQVRFVPRSYLSERTLLAEKDKVDTTTESLTPLYKYPVSDHVPFALRKYLLPTKVAIIDAIITSTGETLPQGSSYINLSLSPVTKRLPNFFYEYPPGKATDSAAIQIVQGDYLVKKASAYDLSFTTRFQGEWPKTLLAFTRNLLFGSGYGSVSLAVDNNYLRLLGETGLLGTFSFIIIFIVLGVYIKKVLPEVESKVIRSFILGFSAGAIGLALNATLIDVFEASKVAFTLWLLVGIVVGSLSLYQAKQFNLYKELLKIASSTYAIITYFILLTIAIFSTTIGSYFIGDDFTWFRWAADCKHIMQNCSTIPSTIFSYFFDSAGFFYRPGTKAYFLVFYHFFSLNQVIYHVVSIFLHLIVVILLYLVGRKILKSNLMASAASLLFLLASGYIEIVLWISATGHLFNAVFILFSLLMFIKWNETKNIFYLITSLVSSLIALTFYELGIITPLLIMAYLFIDKEKYNLKSIFMFIRNKFFLILFIPDIIYFVVRIMSHTHWFNGDYSYNIIKLPFNVVGNTIGYSLISLFGPLSYPFYEKLRDLTKANIPLAFVVLIVFVLCIYFGGKILIKNLSHEEKRILLFASLFTVICLIPFLGLGNITFRYSYLASFGIFMILVVFIRKLYRYLVTFGKDVALASIGTIIAVFCLVHVVQSQQAIIEWNGSGEKIQHFLASIDSLYSDSWSEQNVDLYFANVPVKSGNAWILPVGLSDAVWFAFKSDTINVHTVPTVNDVPQDVYTSLSKWAFEFQPDGSLRRVTKK